MNKQGMLLTVFGLSLSFTACVPEHVDLNRYAAPEGAATQQPEANNPRDIRVIHVTTDATPGTEYEFRALLEDDGSVRIMRYMTIPGDPIDFTMEDLEKGVVTMRRQGRDVITLTSKDGDNRKGGTIEMKYLYEAGLLGDTYRKITMEVRPVNGKWISQLITAKGKTPFNAMFLKKNEKPIIGIVGISEVVTSMKPEKKPAQAN